jgi:ribose transport system ATP-binding protein
VVARRPSAALELSEVVAAMGGFAHESSGPQAERVAREAAAGAVAVRASGALGRELPEVDVVVHAGEVVGLGGLEGHGQQALIRAIWRRRHGRLRLRSPNLQVEGPVAYVSGDRKVEGVFALWSVAQNLSVSVLRRLGRWGILRPGMEDELFATWAERLTIRGGLRDGITSLSGGNQQKVLLARALASGARLVLLDDPLRGVDVTTKHDIYRLIREEAGKGRCFLWFSTENEGLFECDRVYMMRSGRVVRELLGTSATDEELIAASIETGERPRTAGAGAEARNGDN